MEATGATTKKFSLPSAVSRFLSSSALCLVLAAAAWPSSVSVEAAPIRLYLDADRQGTLASTLSIERGMQTALSEVGNRLDGVPVEIVRLDHRGSSPRSRRHLDQYLRDDRALALFSGLHSPPLLAHRDFINQSRILVLDPWAAAGPITRSVSSENWIFRLSVDDTKAGEVIVEHAIVELMSRSPHLLLEQTGWGRSSERAIQIALAARGLPRALVHWFNWDLREGTARILVRQIHAAGADAILLVANSTEGKSIARAMASLPADQRLPIVSHWGITGGDFGEELSSDIRGRFPLCFIQTRFSFLAHPEDRFAKNVFERARRLFPDHIRTRDDFAAPTGFIHAYDLTRLLISAVGQAGLTGTIEADRLGVHAALEDLGDDVQGLIKNYHRPFRPFDASDPDAHEALDRTALVFGRFRDDGVIALEETDH